MTLAFNTWIDVGERNREVRPLLWKTYPTAPMTVGQAYDMAVANRIYMMHRHEPNRVVMQVWIPKPIDKKIYG
jgi:hypothetical protein